MLARIQNDNNGYTERRKERDDRRRSQAQPGNVVPPSPALVRHGSKQRKVPAVLTPGQLTPHSAQAQVHIPIGRNQPTQHPYATGGIGAGYEYAQQHEQYKNQPQQPYGGTSPMIASVGAAPAAVSNIRAPGANAGVGQDYQQEPESEPKPTFLRILTCRC